MIAAPSTSIRTPLVRRCQNIDVSEHSDPLIGLGIRLAGRVSDGRIVVRLWRSDDAAALHQAIVESTEHLRPWRPWIAPEPLTVDQRRALIEEWREPGRRGEPPPWASLSETILSAEAGTVLESCAGTRNRLLDSCQPPPTGLRHPRCPSADGGCLRGAGNLTYRDSPRQSEPRLPTDTRATRLLIYG